MSSFYRNLKAFSDPREVGQAKNYTPVPEDWSVVLCDIRSSTSAIQQGRYKEINLVGVSCITAVLNACNRAEVPYVFGGDGATFVLPPDFLEAAIEGLRATREMAKEQFSFDLRVGSVPHRDLIQAGERLYVGKYFLSQHATMAAFYGQALGLAESWVKDSSQSKYLVQGLAKKRGDYEGLECRWQPLPSQNGEILSVIIRAQSKDKQVAEKTYSELLPKLDEILSLKTKGFSPVQRSNLKIESEQKRLMAEAKIKAHPASPSLVARLRLWVETQLCLYVFKNENKLAGVDWKVYKDDLISNSDYFKYDEMLRFVADVNSEQKKNLLQLLEKFQSEKQIYYGIHSSSSALMTCMVQSRFGKHVHFVDGNDGGYATAALQLKKQMSA